MHEPLKAKVMQMVCMTIDEDDEKSIGETENPKESWDKILTKHGISNGLVTVAIISKITSSQYVIRMSLPDYLNKIQSLHN